MERSMRNWGLYGAVLLVGAAFYALCRYVPADLPVWMPWQFSWSVYLVTCLSLGWYVLGIVETPRQARPAWWRIVFFVVGVLASYAVVQTRYDYLAQHMFFIHRFQHMVLHHLGPFLIAIAWPGETIWRGMPKFLKPPLRARPVRAAVDFIQNPFFAPVLFVGLIYFWLLPNVHDRVMLNENLYNLMNWSMSVDGIFFWCLVLDPRPRPPARMRIGIRALLTMAIVPPQILVGALIALADHDIYPVYDICGRVFPIEAITDQRYGGLILWIPSSMMSVIGLLLVLNNMRLNEEREERAALPVQ
jgi:putative membrane protein